MGKYTFCAKERSSATDCAELSGSDWEWDMLQWNKTEERRRKRDKRRDRRGRAREKCSRLCLQTDTMDYSYVRYATIPFFLPSSKDLVCTFYPPGWWRTNSLADNVIALCQSWRKKNMLWKLFLEFSQVYPPMRINPTWLLHINRNQARRTNQ